MRAFDRYRSRQKRIYIKKVTEQSNGAPDVHVMPSFGRHITISVKFGITRTDFDRGKNYPATGKIKGTYVTLRTLWHLEGHS